MVAALIDLALTGVIGAALLVALAWFRAANLLQLADLAGHLISAGTIALVATVFLAGFEASPLEASPGKQALGLRVRRHSDGDRLGLGRALARNLLKLGLPAPLAYLAVLAAAEGGGLEAWVGVGAAAVVALTYLVGVLFGDGRAAYDQVAGTAVIRALPGRRFA